MEKRVRVKKLEKLSKAAKELDFRETFLRLDGLREHIQCIESLEGKEKARKVQWLARKIEISKPAIENEIGDNDAPSFFYMKKEIRFRRGVFIGLAANAGLGIIGAKLLINGSSEAFNYGFPILGAMMVATTIFMIANTFMNRFATYSGFANNVRDTLLRIEHSIRNYLDRNPLAR